MDEIFAPKSGRQRVESSRKSKSLASLALSRGFEPVREIIGVQLRYRDWGKSVRLEALAHNGSKPERLETISGRSSNTNLESDSSHPPPKSHSCFEQTSPLSCAFIPTLRPYNWPTPTRTCLRPAQLAHLPIAPPFVSATHRL